MERLEAHGEICKTDPCQLWQEAQRRIKRALDSIENAQGRLGDALADLSSLVGCNQLWTTGGKIYDRVHAFWYRVEAKRKAGKFELDGISAEALRKSLKL